MKPVRSIDIDQIGKLQKSMTEILCRQMLEGVPAGVRQKT